MRCVGRVARRVGWEVEHSGLCKRGSRNCLAVSMEDNAEMDLLFLTPMGSCGTVGWAMERIRWQSPRVTEVEI
jgi:hypothetical protein